MYLVEAFKFFLFLVGLRRKRKIESVKTWEGELQKIWNVKVNIIIIVGSLGAIPNNLVIGLSRSVLM